MSLSLPPSTPPEQTPYCEPAQISKDDRTGADTFYVPEQPGRIIVPELDYYIDQNALPPPLAPAVPPRQPAQTTEVIPAYKEEDDSPTIANITKGRLVTTMRPVLKIPAQAQVIQGHMNGRYNKVIRAHLSPYRS